MPESPHIDFRIHESRNGSAGARSEFETVIAQLVRALYQDSHPVWANPGDWGIDVFRGNLQGKITVWQCKYFLKVGSGQYTQIKKSLDSALRSAKREGYAVEQWILCIPCELDGPAHRWWEDLRTMYLRQHSVSLQLWDKAALEEQFWRPQARHLRHSFYGGEAPLVPAEHSEPHDDAIPPRDLLDAWEAGDEVAVNGHRYLLRDSAVRRGAAAPGASSRSFLAIVVGTSNLAWIRQASGRGTEQRREGLRRQHREGGPLGLPSSREFVERDEVVTLVTDHPVGRTWHDVYGAGPLSPDSLTRLFLTTVAAGRFLQRLHIQGFDHRELDGAAFLLHAQEVRLRDGGLMGVPGTPRDSASAYQAPEQAQPPYSAGPRTDLFQLASLVWHTLTGRPPHAGPFQPSLRLTQSSLSDGLDEALRRALRPAPEERGDMESLIQAVAES